MENKKEKKLNGWKIWNVEINTLLLPLGIIPAIFILYFIIGGYEKKINEKNTIFLFIAGIVAGIVIYIMEGMIFYQILTEATYLDIIILFSFLFSFLDQLVKFAVVNMGRFKGEALPVYGASFSCGISAVFAPLLFGKSFEVSLSRLPLLLIPFAVMFFNCSAGILIGTGIKRNDKFKYFAWSLVAGMVIWIMVMTSIIYSMENNSISASISVLSIILSFIILYYAYNNILPYGMLEKRELRKRYKNL